MTTVEQIEKHLESKAGGLPTPLVPPARPQHEEDHGSGPSSMDVSHFGNALIPQTEACGATKEVERAESKPKEATEDIKKAPGYEELDEEEKKLCEDIMLFPRPYQAFKKKLINKALKTRNAIRRAHALEFVDKLVTKPKAYAIFDSLATRNLLPNLK